MTSFPFRILHSNDAFHQLMGRNDFVGNPIYDAFVAEGNLSPSIATCSTPLGSLDEQILKLSRSGQDLFCKIKVHRVQREDTQGLSNLRYYALSFSKLQTAAWQPSPVYLPMPAGSMDGTYSQLDTWKKGGQTTKGGQRRTVHQSKSLRSTNRNPLSLFWPSGNKRKRFLSRWRTGHLSQSNPCHQRMETSPATYPRNFVRSGFYDHTYTNAHIGTLFA